MAKLRIELPEEERGRSPDDIARLDRLKARLTRTDLKPKQREAAEVEIASLLSAPARAADAAWELRSADESTTLAEARGEDVERLRSGALFVKTRDPLQSLLRANRLTADQYDAGLACRDAYGARAGDLGSQMSSLSAGAPHNNDRYVFTRLQRAKALQRILTIERTVALDAKDALGRWDPNALTMLRVVCSEGKSLSSQGDGRAFERNIQSLIAALNVASDVLRGR